MFIRSKTLSSEFASMKEVGKPAPSYYWLSSNSIPKTVTGEEWVYLDLTPLSYFNFYTLEQSGCNESDCRCARYYSGHPQIYKTPCHYTDTYVMCENRHQDGNFFQNF